MVPDFISGSTLWESVWAAGVFIVSILFAWLVFLVMRWVEGRMRPRRKHPLISQLLASVNRPVFILIVTQGLLLAIAVPTYLADARNTITTVSVALAIAVVTYGLARLAGTLLVWYLRSQGVRKKVAVDEGLVRFLRRIVLVIVYIIGILILLDYLTIEISPLIAGLGIGGLAVALALQPTLANFFAGTQIISDRIVKVGDYIELDANTRGYVTDVGWRSTRIRTPYNNMLIIPNSRLADSIFTNYYGPDMKMAVLVSCGVSYDSDLSRVQDIALEVTREVTNDLSEAVKDFVPSVRFEEFGDSNINFWIWVQAVDRSGSFMLKSELIRRLHARFNQEGIDINYPMRHLVYDGDSDELPPLIGGPPGEE